jgi:hypothetical protein
VTPTILGGLHENRVTRTASFEVLVSPPSLSSASQVVGHGSLLSKTPSGTGAHVEAFVDRSSTTVWFARGTCCSSKISKSFLASKHGVSRWPTVDHCSCILL